MLGKLRILADVLEESSRAEFSFLRCHILLSFDDHFPEWESGLKYSLPTRWNGSSHSHRVVLALSNTPGLESRHKASAVCRKLSVISGHTSTNVWPNSPLEAQRTIERSNKLKFKPAQSPSADGTANLCAVSAFLEASSSNQLVHSLAGRQ